MMENKEFQDILRKYPDDATIALQVHFNGEREILWDVTVEGIIIPLGESRMKVIVLGSDGLDLEYEALLNGSDFDETVYRE